ncbi:MAG TPA: molybdenum cofactor biosynthesis protein MoaE [Jatrophihabitans sp.]|nr:molybdenum cofactor biosynthesis protein MoaE [Jatrophihabitans sp.]
MSEFAQDLAARAGMKQPGGDVDPVLRLVGVSDAPIDASVHEAAVDHVRAGARVLFCGVVREHDHGRGVVELEYQGHPSAEQVLTEIATEFAAEPGVLALAVSHRVGVLQVGDVALVAAVATAHRREAFDVCGRLVEEVKARLPIWKRQVFTDGTDEWVNCP